MKEYAEWKTVVWRFVRSGIAGAAGAVISVQIILAPSWTNGKEYLLALTAAGVAGFISALALSIRNEFGNENKDSAIDKLPL